MVMHICALAGVWGWGIAKGCGLYNVMKFTGKMQRCVAVAETHISPETRKAPRESSVDPLIHAVKIWIHSAPAVRCWEVVLECFDDEGGVAVQFASDR
jgi:hypothetical protein